MHDNRKQVLSGRESKRTVMGVWPTGDQPTSNSGKLLCRNVIERYFGTHETRARKIPIVAQLFAMSRASRRSVYVPRFSLTSDLIVRLRLRKLVRISFSTLFEPIRL